MPRERRPSEPAALRLLFDAIRTAGRAAAIELDPLYERWQRTGAVLVCTVEVEQGDDVAVVAIDDVEGEAARQLGDLARARIAYACYLEADPAGPPSCPRLPPLPRPHRSRRPRPPNRRGRACRHHGSRPRRPTPTARRRPP